MKGSAEDWDPEPTSLLSSTIAAIAKPYEIHCPHSSKHDFVLQPVAPLMLTLRQWKDADLEPFAAMNADPEVMRYFPALMTKEETAASMERHRRAIDERGWGLWAVEVDGVFAGSTGLSVPSFTAHFTPCTEIGWRFRQEFWGRGLASRAAREALRYGFEVLHLSEIVSFTAEINIRSRKLMERLGLVRDVNGDFDHPAIPEGHALRRHVLYRVKPDVTGSGRSGGSISR